MPIFPRLKGGQGSAGDDAPWSELFDALNELSCLSDGWNGYSAPAPSEHTIHVAADFLAVMQEHGCVPSRIAASAVGGVGITRRLGDRKAYIEFLNSGLISRLLADDRTESMDTQRVENNRESFEAVISDIEAFLHG
jgi:hypothetical protein